eukprot:350803_1
MQLHLVKSTDIDDILNEIDENEKKSNTNTSQNLKIGNVNWDQILTEIRNGNINYIKTAITSKHIKVNEQNPKNGQTLLHIAVIQGNMNLCKLLCDFGADVTIKDFDGDDPCIFAMKFGKYKITELLYYRQLSASLGNDLKEISVAIYSKNQQAKILNEECKLEMHPDECGFDSNFSRKWHEQKEKYENSPSLLKGIMENMVTIIKKRQPFSGDMLYFAWYYVLNHKILKYCPLLSPLWKAMMSTYESILANTSDKEGWLWLKTYFIPSLIWYLPHPYIKNVPISLSRAEVEELQKSGKIQNGWIGVHKHLLCLKGICSSKEEDREEEYKQSHDNESNDMEIVLQECLFWELLCRVRKESKKQSDLLLKDKINRIKTTKTNDWNELIKYNVKTNYSNVRQDIWNKAKYKEDDLNEDLYPPSTHFSAKKFYDTSIFLNELMFTANILDNVFQTDMKIITEQICLETGDKCSYKAGPVKTLIRSQAKIENDYISCAWPKSAKILDINRCSLQFDTIDEMMKFIKIFTKKVNTQNAFSIIEIIRCKNGWAIYSAENPQYTDLKMNVLVQSPTNELIASEIQFLLNVMSAFKVKAHKLYSIERRLELVHSFQKLQNEMSKFSDHINSMEVMIDLIKRNDLKYFTCYWSTLTPNINTLTSDMFHENPWQTALLHVMINVNDVCEFLNNNYKQLLCETVFNYFQQYIKNRANNPNEHTQFKNFAQFFSEMYNQIPNYLLAAQDMVIPQFIKFILLIFSENISKLKELLLLTSHGGNSDTIIGGLIHSRFYKHELYINNIESIKLILHSDLLKYEDKIELFEAKTKTFKTALTIPNADCACEIIRFFSNDKHNMQLLFESITYTYELYHILSLTFKRIDCMDVSKILLKYINTLHRNEQIKGLKSYKTNHEDANILWNAVIGNQIEIVTSEIKDMTIFDQKILIECIDATSSINKLDNELLNVDEKEIVAFLIEFNCFK